MKTLLFLIATSLASSPYDLYISEELLGDLAQIKQIDYPAELEIAAEGNHKLTITLSKGGT